VNADSGWRVQTYVWNENNYQAMVEVPPKPQYGKCTALSLPHPTQAENDGTEDVDKSYTAQGNGKFMQSSIGGTERKTYRVEADAKEEPAKEKKAGKAGGTVDPGIKAELKVASHGGGGGVGTGGLLGVCVQKRRRFMALTEELIFVFQRHLTACVLLAATLQKLMAEEFGNLKHMLAGRQVGPSLSLAYLPLSHPSLPRRFSAHKSIKLLVTDPSFAFSQRRKETEADAQFKDFYKNKYRRSHMHNSRFIDTNHKYSKSIASVKNSPKVPTRPLGRSVLDNSAPETEGSLFDTIGPFKATEPILDRWSSASSRLHQHTTVAMEGMSGTGSSWSYQYGKEQVSHRGPPYQVNNTTAVWQR